MSELCREQRLNLRLTEDEYRLVALAAKKRSSSPGAFGREVLVAAARAVASDNSHRPVRA